MTKNVVYLFELASSRRIEEFSLELSKLNSQEAIMLSELKELIKKLMLEFIKHSDVETLDDDFVHMYEIYEICCCFAIVQLKKQVVQLGKSKTEICEMLLVLKQEFKQIQEELITLKTQMQHEDFNEAWLKITEWINNTICFDENKWALQLELVNKINKSNARILTQLLNYIENIQTKDELKNAERFDISHYTKKELQEEYAKRTYHRSCFSFFENVSATEFEEYNKITMKAKNATCARDFVFAISEEDAYLNMWQIKIPMFPYSTYMYIVDDEYDIEFKSES